MIRPCRIPVRLLVVVGCSRGVVCGSTSGMGFNLLPPIGADWLWSYAYCPSGPGQSFIFFSASIAASGSFRTAAFNCLRSNSV